MDSDGGVCAGGNSRARYCAIWARKMSRHRCAVRFEGDMTAGLRANLWLRCCDRALLEMGRFEARTFDEL